MKTFDNSEKKSFFTNQDLKRMILPLFCEQFLTILVGCQFRILAPWRLRL